jgi:hypothetical protein
VSATPPSPQIDQCNQADEIKRDKSELDDRQLDDVSGGSDPSASSTVTILKPVKGGPG